MQQTSYIDRQRPSQACKQRIEKGHALDKILTTLLNFPLRQRTAVLWPPVACIKAVSKQTGTPSFPGLNGLAVLPKGNKNRRQFISCAQPNIKSERKKYWGGGGIKNETKKTQAVKDREKMRQTKKKKKKEVEEEGGREGGGRRGRGRRGGGGGRRRGGGGETRRRRGGGGGRGGGGEEEEEETKQTNKKKKDFCIKMGAVRDIVMLM